MTWYYRVRPAFSEGDELPNAPKDSSHLAQALAVITINRCVGIICRQQPDMAVLHGEGLHCCFAVNHGCDNLTFFATLLAADDDKVSIADSCIDHGITLDLEREEISLADNGFGKGEGLLDCLFGASGVACWKIY